MIIKGWQKTSLIDFKDKIATTIFVASCNLLCPYCHNADLIFEQKNLKKIEEDEIINYIEKKEKLLDALCVSGGEPTIYKDLPLFLEKIKKVCKNENKNFLIKLDTNGTNYNMLKMLIEENLIDYVAMDIKNSFEKYEKTTKCSKEDLENIKNSIELLKASDIDYEFRTTISKAFIDEEDIKKIANMLKGCKNYYLQQYKYSNKQIKDTDFLSYSVEELHLFKGILEKSIKNVEIRNE